MLQFNFDLEDAESELERVSHLLMAFTEFHDREYPDGKEPIAMAVFADRSKIYCSLVISALTKINEIRAAMSEAINESPSGKCRKNDVNPEVIQ